MNDKSALQASGRVARSMELYEQALELIPGGTQLVSRRPTRFAYGISPVYTTQASGARFTDVDGHEYVDWMSGIGAIILGYADPVVDQAVVIKLFQRLQLNRLAKHRRQFKINFHLD